MLQENINSYILSICTGNLNFKKTIHTSCNMLMITEKNIDVIYNDFESYWLTSVFASQLKNTSTEVQNPYECSFYTILLP